MAKMNFIVRGGADFGGLEKAMKKTQGSVKSFQGKITASLQGIGKQLAGLGLAIGAAKIIKESYEMARQTESNMMNINKNLGNNAKNFQEWVDSNAKQFGIAKSDAYSYGATFSNLVSSFEKDSSRAEKTTEKLIQSAAVIASATGRSFEDVSNRIRSGMLGSNEAIEDLGVYTKVSVLETTKAFEELANGKSWQQLDHYTQQQIITQAILEQSLARYGDTLSDTVNTRQNQFIASLKNVALSLGQAFLPIVNVVLPILTALADALGFVVGILAQFMTAIFGSFKMDAKPVEALGAGVAGIASGVEDIGDNATKSGKKAAAAAKKAEKATLGIDAINKLGSKKASAGSSGGGASSGGSVGGLGALAPKSDGKGLISGAVEVSEKIKTIVEGIKNTIGEVFEWIRGALESIGFFDTLQRVWDFFVTVFTGIGEAFQEFWDNHAAPITQGFQDAWDTLGAVIVSNWEEVIRPVIDIIIAKLTEFWEQYGQPLLTKVLDAIGWVLRGILGLWNNVIGPFFIWLNQTFGPIIGKLVDWIMTDLNKFFGGASLIIGGIFDIFAGLGMFLTGDFQGAWARMSQGVKSIMDGIKLFIGSAVQRITDIFKLMGLDVSGVFDGLKQTFDGIIKFIDGVFKGNWEQAWEGIADIIGGVFKTVVNLVAQPINVLIGLINWVFEQINKLSFTVPDWIPGIGGKRIGFNLPMIPKIPALATGGITDVNSPFLAQIGDNRTQREVVAPLEDLKGMIATVVSQAVGGSEGDLVVVIQNPNEVTGQEVYRQSLKQARREGFASI